MEACENEQRKAAQIPKTKFPFIAYINGEPRSICLVNGRIVIRTSKQFDWSTLR